MKRIVGRLLQRVVVAVREGVGLRIVDRVERLGGVVRAHVTRQRRRSRRIVWDLAGITRQRRRSRRIVWDLAGITRQRRRSRRIVWDLAGITRQRRRSRRIVWDLAGMGVAVISGSRLVSVNIRMSRISSIV